MSASKSIEPASVLPREAWHGVLIETAVEVFSLMVGVTVVPDLDAPRAPIQITAIVGIAGAIRANFILQCSTTSTIRLASQMLGIPLDEPDSKKAALDALGEICNIVAGFFKAKVGLGDACNLSVPVIITGQDYRFCSRTTYERLELPLAYEGETLWASLEIAQ
jgi:CheY-specific phosphatase CheX